MVLNFLTSYDGYTINICTVCQCVCSVRCNAFHITMLVHVMITIFSAWWQQKSTFKHHQRSLLFSGLILVISGLLFWRTGSPSVLIKVAEEAVISWLLSWYYLVQAVFPITLILIQDRCDRFHRAQEWDLHRDSFLVLNRRERLCFCLFCWHYCSLGAKAIIMRWITSQPRRWLRKATDKTVPIYLYS